MSKNQTARQEFRQAIEEEMKATSCDRVVAASRVNKRRPELAQAVIDEANPDRPRAA